MFDQLRDLFKILLNVYDTTLTTVNYKNIVKDGLSPSKRTSFYFLQLKPFKKDEKCFSFYPKNSFRSQGIYIFVLIF